MRQSGLLLDDNRDVSEACVTRPLVEIIVRPCYGPTLFWSELSDSGSQTHSCQFHRMKGCRCHCTDWTARAKQAVPTVSFIALRQFYTVCALYDKLIELFVHMHYAHEYRRKWGVT